VVSGLKSSSGNKEFGLKVNSSCLEYGRDSLYCGDQKEQKILGEDR
jgi:hypothetical protein